MRLRILAALVLIAASIPSVPAFAETPAETAADCEARFGFGPGGCKCIVESWAKFNETQRVYLAAIAKGDEAAAKAAEAEMTEQQTLQVGFFMANYSSAFEC